MVSPVFYRMNSIQFVPVNAANLRAFVDVTHETLWSPVWPGADAVAQDFWRWPSESQAAAHLITCRSELIGRVVMPQLDDYLIIRDLGVRAAHAARVVDALVQRAAAGHARTVRAIVHEPLSDAFAARGFAEQKRRITMRHDLRGVPGPMLTLPVRHVSDHADRDGMDIGELMHEAYRGTVDDEDEPRAVWTLHAHDVLGSHYGVFLDTASFVTPPTPPFYSATLVIESAPRSAVLGQVVTRRSHTNRGYARCLIMLSLAALAARDYHECFLEATTTNANAMHLYRVLGFRPSGPQIVYSVRHL